MIINNKLDVSINNYLKKKGLLGRLGFFLIRNFSSYKLTFKGSKSSSILLLINNEFNLRKDHLEQITTIHDKLLELGYDSLLVTAVRKLSFNKSDSLIDQFEKVYINLFNNFKKVLVFCDSVPLQNYLVYKFNQSNIETYSLQHGFYLDDLNEVFLKVYIASNSKNFFVWDYRTLKNFNKHNPNRNYIKVGPHCKKYYKPIIDNKIVNKVAIFGCGKDQILENIYLSKIYKSLLLTGHDPIFICHPKFNLIDRIKFYLSNNVLASRNIKKHSSYRLSLVLNSSVFLEIEEKGDNFFLLNKYFSQNIFPTHEELFEINRNNDKILKPFHGKEESLKIIIKNLTNDL